MPSSPARRLIVVYVVLALVSYLITVLPGGPSFSSPAGAVFGIALDAALVFLLWFRSRLAWVLLFALALLAPVAFFMMGPPHDVGSIALTAIFVAQAATLATPALFTFVWSRRTVAPL